MLSLVSYNWNLWQYAQYSNSFGEATASIYNIILETRYSKALFEEIFKIIYFLISLISNHLALSLYGR